MLGLLVIFLLLGPTFQLVVAAMPSQSASWYSNDANSPLNWNYSPQTDIVEGNVQSLQVSWTFPVPSAPPPFVGAEGVMVTPLVVDGIVYIITNWHRVFALNAADGSVVWYKDLPLQDNYSLYLQPSVPGPLGLPLGHYHQMIYTRHILSRPLIWIIANTNQIFALDALSGDIKIGFNPLAIDYSSIHGNFGTYDVDTPMFLVDDKNGILLFGPSVSEGESSGRGFIEEWDVSSGIPTFVWRDYIIPPQDGSDPSWSLESVGNMTYAYSFDGTSALDLKSLPSGQLRGMLLGDWGTLGFDGNRSYAGASTAWGGSWAIDEKAGVAYFGTSTATPDWNATQRPGLDLWSDSVLAVDLASGKIIWGFQAMPHPLGDFDCSWNVVLANETIGGQTQPVVFKGCKFGYIFALDARTGSMLWFVRPPSVSWKNVAVLNPLNKTQMSQANWPGYPATGSVIQNPSDTGALESDLAFDPTKNMIFAAVYNSPKSLPLTDVGATVPFNRTQWQFNWGVDIFGIRPAGPTNTTVMAIDGATGRTEWSQYIPNVPYRGGLTVSGGVVYASTLDGILRYFAESTGNQLGQKVIGGSLIAQPSIGQDINGNEMLYLTDMGSSRWGPVFPGFVQALSPEQPAAPYLPAGFALLLTLAVIVSVFVVAGFVLLSLRTQKRVSSA